MVVTVVLATYNRAASLQTTLETFRGLKCPPALAWELLLIDNNSSDDTREVIQKFAATAPFPVRSIFEKRQGKSAALNTGVANAKGEIVAFTDDDVLLHPDWLTHLTGTFDNLECAAVAGRIVPLWNHPKPDWLEMEGQQAVVNFEFGDEFKEIRVPPLGANSAFRKEVFARYGSFRLDLGPNESRHTITCEDWEFGDRVMRGGEKIVYCPTAIVYHPVDPKRTTKKYFLDWYYYNGVSLTRMAGLPDFGVFYFGVPRWLYRELLVNGLRWMFTFDKNRRFDFKLKTYRSIGTIAESNRLSRLKAAAQVSAELQHE